MKKIMFSLAEAIVETINFIPNKINDCRVICNFLNQDTYKTQQEFDTAFEEEKRLLGIEHLTIEVYNPNTTGIMKKKLVDGTEVPYSYTHCFVAKNRVTENYVMVMSSSERIPGFVWHELYHIKRMHKGKINWRYSFIPLNKPYEEWLATSYAIKRAEEEGKNGKIS